MTTRHGSQCRAAIGGAAGFPVFDSATMSGKHCSRRRSNSTTQPENIASRWMALADLPLRPPTSISSASPLSKAKINDSPSALEIHFEHHCHQDPRRNHQLMDDPPSRSLVINATGRRKDLTGLPLFFNQGRFAGCPDPPTTGTCSQGDRQ